MFPKLLILRYYILLYDKRPSLGYLAPSVDNPDASTPSTSWWLYNPLSISLGIFRPVPAQRSQIIGNNVCARHEPEFLVAVLTHLPLQILPARILSSDAK